GRGRHRDLLADGDHRTADDDRRRGHGRRDHHFDVPADVQAAVARQVAALGWAHFTFTYARACASCRRLTAAAESTISANSSLRLASADSCTVSGSNCWPPGTSRV